MVLREADLQHHLSVEDDRGAKAAKDAKDPKGAKPVDKIIAGPAAGQSATATVVPKGAPKADPKADAKGDAKKDAPLAKDGKKDDVQLSAALNHLKGLPLATAAVSQ